MANENQGIAWSTPNIRNGEPITGTVENVTVYGNGAGGMTMGIETLPGWTIKDSLFVNNSRQGFWVNNDSGPTIDIEYSAFWNNEWGAVGGTANLGTGSITAVQPIFASTDINDPLFMYLDPSTSLAIVKGASDGGYIGARGLSTAIFGGGDEDKPSVVPVSSDHSKLCCRRFRRCGRLLPHR